MKTKTLTIGFLLFVLTSCLAQKDRLELGWYIGPNFNFSERADLETNNKFSTGIFYNVCSNKVFGFGAGVNYQQLHLNVGRAGGFFGSRSREEKFNFLKFPFWSSINMNYRSTDKTRIYFVAGVAYGNLLNTESATVLYNLEGLKSDHFFVNAGLEFKRPLNENYQFTLGTHLDLTNIYDVRYGNIYSFQVVFGVGRIWK